MKYKRSKTTFYSQSDTNYQPQKRKLNTYPIIRAPRSLKGRETLPNAMFLLLNKTVKGISANFDWCKQSLKQLINTQYTVETTYIVK